VSTAPPETLPGLTVSERFSGPPGSANGGYIAGRLAAYVGSPAVQVTLRQPPPLDTRLDVVRTADEGVRAVFGGALIAEAAPAVLDDDPVEPVSFGMAAEAAGAFAGFAAHPFPGCFVCGTDRPAPDGLGLRPGPVPDRPGSTACTWVPDASLATDDGTVPPEIMWAALDCPGGWTVDIVGRPAVLGRMTAQIDVLPQVGDRCVVMGRLLSREGRKSVSVTTAYDGEGRVLGRAHAIWIDIRSPSPSP
jgi:hypothetical protein